MSTMPEFVVTDSHPALAGHFPGSPVVPGTVVLDNLLTALDGKDADRIRQIDRVKFVAPLPVNVPCRVQTSPMRNGAMMAECIAGDRLVLSAVIRLRPGTGKT